MIEWKWMNDGMGWDGMIEWMNDNDYYIGNWNDNGNGNGNRNVNGNGNERVRSFEKKGTLWP